MVTRRRPSLPLTHFEAWIPDLCDHGKPFDVDCKECEAYFDVEVERRKNENTKTKVQS
jgi:hypothetical protein